MNKDISDRLRQYYRESGLSLERLAALSDTSKTTVHSYVNGAVTNPREDTLRRIAEALGHTLEELYSDAQETPTEALRATQERIAMLEEQVANERAARISAEEALERERKEAADVRHELKMTRKVYEAERNEYKNRIIDLIKRNKAARRWIIGLGFAVCILAAYAAYCFAIFDAADPTRGLWRMLAG